MLDVNKLRQNGLYRQLHTVALPANTITEGTITITSQRGNVQAVGVLVAGGSDADYVQNEFTLADNGKNFVEKDNLLAYSPSYRFRERVLSPVELQQNGVLNYSFNNKSATALTVVIELYFYNPFDNYYRN